MIGPPIAQTNRHGRQLRKPVRFNCYLDLIRMQIHRSSVYYYILQYQVQ